MFSRVCQNWINLSGQSDGRWPHVSTHNTQFLCGKIRTRFFKIFVVSRIYLLLHWVNEKFSFDLIHTYVCFFGFSFCLSFSACISVSKLRCQSWSVLFTRSAKSLSNTLLCILNNGIQKERSKKLQGRGQFWRMRDVRQTMTWLRKIGFQEKRKQT